jgi:hypothetical protein
MRRLVGQALLATVALMILGALTASVSFAASPSAVLGEGGSGSFQWSVKLSHQDGPQGAGRLGAQRPCLIATTTWKVDTFSYYRSRSRSCVHLPGRLAAFEPPLVVSGGQPSSGAPVKQTAVGMVFALAVRRVQIDLCDGREETINLDPTTPAQSREARLARFRYSAFSVSGEWCADRIVSRDSAGRTLWDSDVASSQS